MENAVEALKMAFAVMVFIIALSVSMISFSKVKATSDLVLYTKDETNYYEYQGAIGRAAENRIVGLETIIPTLYKYYKENYTVLFREGNYNFDTGELSNVSYLRIYTTPSSYQTPNRRHYLWGKQDGTQSSYDTLMQNKYDRYFTRGYNQKGNQEIFSFDLEEETLRHEPWTGTYEKAMENLSCFLSGDTYKNPNNNADYIKYGDTMQQGNGGFAYRYANRKFVETIGEYTYSSNQADSTEDGSTVSSLVKPKKKRVIIFTLIKGN